MSTPPFLTQGNTIGIVATARKITYEEAAPAIGMLVRSICKLPAHILTISLKSNAPADPRNVAIHPPSPRCHPATPL